MELAVDSNVVFSAMVKDSLTRSLLCNPNLLLYAPEALISEMHEHSEEIKEKSGLSENRWKEVTGILLSKIRLVPKEEIALFLKEALEFSPDQEDAPFFALCLARGIPLWSNDKALKQQSAVRVFSTDELAKLLLK